MRSKISITISPEVNDALNECNVENKKISEHIEFIIGEYFRSKMQNLVEESVLKSIKKPIDICNLWLNIERYYQGIEGHHVYRNTDYSIIFAFKDKD